MNNTEEICAALFNNGTYLWDMNLAYGRMKMSENLCEMLGLTTGEVSAHELEMLVLESYRSIYTFEYMHMHKRWSMPVVCNGQVHWFTVTKVQFFADKNGDPHIAGFAQIENSEQLSPTEVESGIDAETVFSLIELLPELNNDETFYDGIHKLLTRVYEQVPNSAITVLQWLEPSSFLCCEVVGEPLEDVYGGTMTKGSIIESDHCRRLCESRKLVTCNDTNENKADDLSIDEDFAGRNKVRAYMSVPIILNTGKVWGIVNILKNTPTSWSRVDRNWITVVAKLVVSCMAQAQKNERLREQLDVNNMACRVADIQTWVWSREAGNRRTVINNAMPHTIEDSIEKQIHKADQKKYLDAKLALTQGREDVMDVTLRCRPAPDQPYQWHSIKGQVMERDEDGLPRVIAGVSHNVDKKVRADIEEKRQRAFQQSIYDKLPVGIEVFDANGDLTYANEKLLDIYGVSGSWRKASKSINLFTSAMLTDEQKQTIRDLGTSEYTFNYDHSKLSGYYDDEHKLPAELTMRASKIYERNQLKGYVLVLVDNSKLMEQKRKIDLFTEYMDTIGSFAKLGVFWKGENDNNMASEQWIKNFNAGASGNIFSCHFYDNVNLEDLEAFRAQYARLISKQIDALQQNLRVTQDDGSEHWVSLNFVRNDAINGVTGVSLDITNQKLNEKMLVEARAKAERADMLKSQFLANMSHEIRTPLNAIVGFSQLMCDEESRTEREQYAEIVSKNTDLLLKLIGDILDLSKIESGTLEFSYDMNVVSDLCDDIYKSLLPRTPDGVQFIYEEPKQNSDVSLYCDGLRIKQVVINFITNAFKFTTRGEVRLWFEVENNRLSFHVKDTGKGIAPDKMESIFESFVKLDAFAVGTGIGLAISRSIARQMGGDIEVESVVGEGSHFRLVLPNINDDSLYWRDAVAWQRTIMVLSENSEELSYFSNCLLNYNMLRAEYVGFAQFWLEKHPPLTIIDHRAYPVAIDELIKSIHGKGPQYKVIVVFQNEEEVVETGADSTVVMPIGRDDFMAEVNKYVL